MCKEKLQIEQESVRLSQVKEIAVCFLRQPIIKTEIPFVVVHPFYASPFFNNPGTNKVVNILEFAEGKKQAEQMFQSLIMGQDTIESVVSIVRRPYQLTFLRYIKPFLTQEEFSKLLGSIYVYSENPNDDPNVPLKMLRSWFSSAIKTDLMTEEEYMVYSDLPERFTIYRGVGVGRVRDGLSWTRDLSEATWFANRFNNKKEHGYILEAEIDKKDVFAYFKQEKEIVCYPKRNTIHMLANNRKKLS